MSDIQEKKPPGSGTNSKKTPTGQQAPNASRVSTGTSTSKGNRKRSETLAVRENNRKLSDSEDLEGSLRLIPPMSFLVSSRPTSESLGSYNQTNSTSASTSNKSRSKTKTKSSKKRSTSLSKPTTRRRPRSSRTKRTASPQLCPHGESKRHCRECEKRRQTPDSIPVDHTQESTIAEESTADENESAKVQELERYLNLPKSKNMIDLAGKTTISHQIVPSAPATTVSCCANRHPEFRQQSISLAIDPDQTWKLLAVTMTGCLITLVCGFFMGLFIGNKLGKSST